MMVSSGCISMWKNGRSRRYLEQSYFNKCFRRKTHKKTYIIEYCYLRARYVSTCEKISWKRRYASAKVSKAWIYCDTANLLQQKAQSVWAQPPVADKSRRLRGRKPSKTGNHRYTELFVSKKQQILWSRMIASLAFTKLCWFASSSAGNRKLRRAGNNGFVFILSFHRRCRKMKICSKATSLTLFYLSTAGKRKRRTACESFASSLLLDLR